MKYMKKTISLIEKYKKLGYTIVENRSYKFDENKYNSNKIVVKLAQTNDRMRGFPKRVIWAIKEKKL